MLLHRLLPVPLIAALSLTFMSLAGPAAAGDTVQRIEIRAGEAGTVVATLPTSPGEATSPGEPGSPVPPPSGTRAGWRLQQTVGSVLKAVSFADPLNGYASAELGAVYKTTNGGTSWTRIMNIGFPYYWYGVQAFSAQTALIVGFQNQSGAGVARWTDDGGASWTSDIVIDPANWLLALKFADAQHGMAYGNQGYAYVTSNGGRTAADWTRVLTDPERGWLAGNFTYRTDGNAYAAGIKFCHSTDFGYSWTIAHSADQVFDGGCSFPDLTHGWTGGGQISAPVQGWVHRTTDGGATWSGRLMNPPYPIRIVQFFDENFGFAAGGNIYTSAGGIWSTTDGGTSWNLDINTGAEMCAIDYKAVSADSMDVWCVGFLPNFSGVFYKTRIARHEPAGVDDGNGNLAILGARAMPNPFYARTEVRIPGSAAVVIDPAGRRVRTLVAERAGAFVWDGLDDAGRQVAPGVYLLRAVDGSGPAARIVRLR